MSFLCFPAPSSPRTRNLGEHCKYSIFGGSSETQKLYVAEKQRIINKEKTLQSTALIAKSKLAKPFTKSHHATSAYYNFPTGYEQIIFLKWTKIGPERSSKPLRIDNEQGTCSQIWRLTRNPPKCNLVDNKARNLDESRYACY